ncbi:MAG TPA: FUSC family protein [Acetobacteraceae bacterium]|nr:FUSC family protein [Acetobacteraceae bacterium]
MSSTALWTGKPSLGPRASVLAARCAETFRIAGPPLLFGLRMWAAVSLALYVAFWLELDNPYWAGLSAAIVCQPQLGASLRKGWFRMVGTMIGAMQSVVLVACFPQNRVLLLAGLAAWGAACAFAATLLRNFASYAAALAGITSAIITADLLGAVGGVDANAAFLLAVARATETCLGIVCAGIVLAATDLGGAPRRLAVQFADLAVAIAAGVGGTLSIAGCKLADTQSVRRDLIRRVVALDPVIDQTFGESAELRYHSPVLQRAVDGLLSALSGWRAIASVHGLSASKARREAATILENLPPELRSASQPDAVARWMRDPVVLYRICELAVRRLITLPATTPTLRLLADEAAQTLAGIAHALDALGLLVADPARPGRRRGTKQFRVADWLPALVNAGRAFITIGTVALFWVVTAWPGGSLAVAFATIVTLVLAPRAEHAYNAAVGFTVGAFLDVVLAAIVAFAVLPALGIERFAGFSLVLAVCLVPIGALLAGAKRPRQVGLFTAMTLLFIPILRPGNPMTYDPATFYNTGLAIVCGAGFGALSYRLLPPLSPAFRTRRLLALTMRDLRRLAMGRDRHDWEGLTYGRLSAMPEQATPLQRAQLLVAFSAGCEIIRLRHIARRLGHGPQLDAALAALAEAGSARAIAQLSRLDAALATDSAGGSPSQAVLRARGSILVLSEALAEHAAYFDGEASA